MKEEAKAMVWLNGKQRPAYALIPMYKIRYRHGKKMIEKFIDPMYVQRVLPAEDDTYLKDVLSMNDGNEMGLCVDMNTFRHAVAFANNDDVFAVSALLRKWADQLEYMYIEQERKKKK